nr:hypothetical protein [uncultured Desulfobacter sp.]
MEKLEVNIRPSLYQFLKVLFIKSHLKAAMGIAVGTAHQIVKEEVLIPCLDINTENALIRMAFDHSAGNTEIVLYHLLLHFQT